MECGRCRLLLLGVVKPSGTFEGIGPTARHHAAMVQSHAAHGRLGMRMGSARSLEQPGGSVSPREGCLGGWGAEVAPSRFTGPTGYHRVRWLRSEVDPHPNLCCICIPRRACVERLLTCVRPNLWDASLFDHHRGSLLKRNPYRNPSDAPSYGLVAWSNHSCNPPLSVVRAMHTAHEGMCVRLPPRALMRKWRCKSPRPPFQDVGLCSAAWGTPQAT